MTGFRRLVVSILPWMMLMGGLIALMVIIASAPRTMAQAAGTICRAAIVLDTSGSIGAGGIKTMQEQIRRLFEPGGIYDKDVQLAFWTFSDKSGNFNAPFNDFVSSRGSDPGFNAKLNSLISSGNTNYEQGFAFHSGQPNSYMKNIVDKADIIAFMTDGEPNRPSGGWVTSPTPRSAGRAAVIKHREAGKLITGAMIGSASQSDLNYVVNGSDSDSKDIFKIKTISDLANKLKTMIDKQCKLVFTPISSTPCRAAIVLDRSGSVGASGIETMRQQVRRLFDPRGLYDDNIKLAFWSFAASTNSLSNYNTPFHDFVSSRGSNQSFNIKLNALKSAGGTSYEQGFAYDAGKSNSYIKNIVDTADIIAFLTDGQPNEPGGGRNDNPSARDAGRDAVLRHKAAGRIVIAGKIGNYKQGSLNYVINGDDNNSKDVFAISSNYNDLAVKLKKEIGDTCKLVGNPPTPTPTPPPPPTYNLVPRVINEKTKVSLNESSNFDLWVNNKSVNQSEPTNWSVQRVIVPAGATLNYTGGGDYKDNFNCASLPYACEQVDQGRLQFNPGDKSFKRTTLTSNDWKPSWKPGMQICYILTIAKPTQNASPVNRFSKQACITIVGIYPYAQIWGGDLRVGRNFGGYISTGGYVDGFTNINNGDIYGSWTEYGIFARNTVKEVGSASGLSGGSSRTAQSDWSKLTFANKGEYGNFDSNMGNIPDTAASLLKRVENPNPSNTSSSYGFNDSRFNKGNLHLFQNTSTGVNFTLQASEIKRGQSFILNVPNGTVTISGNINYEDIKISNLNKIPQLVIIAQNIKIKPNVDNVDAWLIALGNSGPGFINTCDISDKVPTLKQCDKQLRINGPVMAKYLKLYRTTGASNPKPSDIAAETINLPATTYLWLQGRVGSDALQTTYSIELPPYF